MIVTLIWGRTVGETMQNQFHEELISAYLDGVLSDDERARVEQLLASDTECQRTLREFELVRQSLQRLPHESLNIDLRNRVMAELGLASAAPQASTAKPATQWVIIAMSLVAAATILFALSIVFQNSEGSPTALLQDGKQEVAGPKESQNSDGGAVGTAQPAADQIVGNADVTPGDNGDVTPGAVAAATPGSHGNEGSTSEGSAGNDLANANTGAPAMAEGDVPATAVADNPDRNPGNNNQIAADSSQLTIVYDLVVSGSPKNARWLRMVLRESGIETAPTTHKISKKVAIAIQQGLVLGIIPADLPAGQGDEGESELQLVYIRATGKQMDALYSGLLDAAMGDDVEAVLPALAMGVESHLLQATSLHDSSAVMIEMNTESANQMSNSLASQAAGPANLMGGAEMLKGFGKSEQHGLLLILRNSKSAE
jgi:hypothetical protein